MCGLCRDLALEMQHLCGLGSDGAAVMLGIRGGVSKLLKDPGLKQLTMRQLMSHVIKTPEFNVMFPNLMKLATIGLLLPMSTVDCERGFSTLS